MRTILNMRRSVTILQSQRTSVTVGAVSISALLLLFPLLFCMKDFNNPIDPDNETAIPPAPLNLELFMIPDQAKVQGSFSYKYENALGVVYERSLKDSNTFSAVDTLIKNDTTFIDSIGLGYATAYDYRIFAYNKNGISQKTPIVSVTTSEAPDTSPPTINMRYPLKDSIAVAQDSFRVIMEVFDTSGVALVTVKGNNASYDSIEQVYYYDLILNKGINSFTILSKDIHDNVSTVDFDSIFYEPTLNDLEAPLVWAYKIAGKSFINDSALVEDAVVQLSGKVSDASGIKSIIVNDSSSAIADSMWNVTVVMVSEVYKPICIAATDNSFNANTLYDTLFAVYKTDLVPPVVVITSHLDSAIVGVDSILLAGTVHDESGIYSMTCLGNDANIVNDTLWSIAIKDLSEYTYNRLVIDTRDNSKSKNLSRDTISIYYNPSLVDTVSPLITINTPNKHDTVDVNAVRVEVAVSDPGSGVDSVTVNGNLASFNGALWTFNVTGLIQNQVNTITIMALDKSTNKNRSYDTVFVYYNYDNIAPLLDISDPVVESLYVVTNTYTVKGSVSDPSGIKMVTVNGTIADTSGGTWSKQITIDVYDYWYKVTAIAEDNSPQGNKDSAHCYFRWDSTYNDTTPPVLSVTSHKADGTDKTGDSSITVSGIVKDPSGATVRANGNLAAIEHDTVWTVANIKIIRIHDQATPVQVIASDNSIWQNADTLTFNVIFDTSLTNINDVTGPEIIVMEGLNPVGEYKIIDSTSLSLNGSVTDPAGVSSFNVTVAGGSPITLSAPTWSYTFQFSGYTNAMIFTATDSLNNVSKDTFTVYCDIPNTKPTMLMDTINHKIRATWTKNSEFDFASYKLWIDTTENIDTSSTPALFSENVNDTTYSYSQADDDRLYYFLVGVNDSAGNCFLSSVWSCKYNGATLTLAGSKGIVTELFSSAMSPDGKHIYKSSWKIFRFSRDDLSGEPTFIDSFFLTGFFDYADGKCEVSPDGKHFYTTVRNIDLDTVGVEWFSRNQLTGALTYGGVLSLHVDRDLGDMIISPDGKHVYVSCYNGSTYWFLRDENTGALSSIGSNTHPSIDIARYMAISPDGKHVYAGGLFSRNYVEVFSRNENTGQLSYVGNIGAPQTRSIAMSPDGKNIYVGCGLNPEDNALKWFSRDQGTGLLTLLGEFKNGQPGFEDLGQVLSVVVSPDGYNVYFVATVNGFYVCTRNVGAGELVVNGLVTKEEYGFPAAYNRGPIFTNPDGKYLYISGAFGHLDEAIVWYKRE